ncbi:unnamed protein product [Orchesella dallaii]|uniref:Glutamate receptor n=1 Tax=Orchesella dallaii TaxID=48710 RepID=A0ABP1RFS3_9HEXA
MKSVSEIYNTSNITYFPRRYSNCTVHLQLSLCEPPKIQYSGTALWRKEFTWFILPSNKLDCDDEKVKLKNHKKLTFETGALVLYGYSSIFFVIFKFNEVHMLCLSCMKRKRLTSIKQLQVSNFYNYIALWRKLHSKLDRVALMIAFDFDIDASAFHWNCNIHKDYVYDAPLCTFIIMMRNLNFSGITESSPLRSRLMLHGGLSGYTIVDTGNAYWIRRNLYEYLSYAMDIKPFAYVYVMEQVPKNFQALIQPFDSKIWGILVLLTMIISLILCYKSRNFNYKHKISSILSTWFSAVKILIDQPAVEVKNFLKNNLSSLGIWCLWSFLAVILSQLYKGTLCSFLANSATPVVPDNLKSVLLSNEMIITQKSISNRIKTENGFSLRMSCFLNVILKDFLENDPEKHSSIYHELYNKVEWIGDDLAKDHFTVDVAVQLLKENKIFNKHSYKTINIPNRYFLLDTTDRVEIFKMQLLFFTGNWISKAQPLPLFMSRVGWIIRQNYLYTRLKTKIAQLYESGLYDRWKRYYDKYHMILYIRNIAKELAHHDGSNFTGRNFEGKQNGISLLNLFHFVYFNERKLSFVSETLPKQVFVIIVLYTLISLAFSFTVLICEVLFNYVINLAITISVPLPALTLRGRYPTEYLSGGVLTARSHYPANHLLFIRVTRH